MTKLTSTLSWDISLEADAGAFETYRQGIADLYEVEATPTRLNDGFSNRSSVSLFENGTIGQGRSAAQTMRRSPALIRRSGLDTVSMILNRTGLVGDCDGVDVRAAPGAVQFRDLARPSASRLDSVDLINLMIPRQRAPSWMLDGTVHGLVLEARSPVGRLLSSHLAVSSEVAAQLTPEEGAAAIDAAFLIAGMGMGKATGEPPPPLQAAAVHRTVRVRASRFIETRLLDPTLTVEEIALATGASRSTLYRAFADHGGVHCRIRDLRLDRARQALRRRIGRYPAVSEIAFQHGFASEAHFGRLFRARFGHAPADTGDLARAGGPHADPSVGTAMRYDAWFDWLLETRTP